MRWFKIIVAVVFAGAVVAAFFGVPFTSAATWIQAGPAAVAALLLIPASATNSEPLTMTLPKGFEIDQAALNSEFPHHFEFAPVEAGALLGRVTVSLEGRQISSPLVAAYGVPSAKRREHKRFIFF